MSTPARITITNGDAETVTVTAVNFDGNPLDTGRALAALITRDGDAALGVVAAHEWASLTPEQPDFAGVTPDENADYSTPAYGAWEAAQHGYDVIPGYGKAYRSGNPPRVAPMPGDAESPTTMAWAYAINHWHKTVTVFDGEERLVVVPFEGLPGTDWEHIECGENFERCSHYAWGHVPDIPEESRDLSMRQWLGLDPMGPESAVEVTVDGVTYAMSRSGACGMYAKRSTSSGPLVGPYQRYGWYASATDDAGRPFQVLVRDAKGRPVKGVRYRYPRTAADAALV